MTSRTEYNTQTPNKPSLFDVQYLRNHRTLDIGVLGYIGIVWPKEHSPKLGPFLLGHLYIYILYVQVSKHRAWYLRAPLVRSVTVLVAVVPCSGLRVLQTSPSVWYLRVGAFECHCVPGGNTKYGPPTRTHQRCMCAHNTHVLSGFAMSGRGVSVRALNVTAPL